MVFKTVLKAWNNKKAYVDFRLEVGRVSLTAKKQRPLTDVEHGAGKVVIDGLEVTLSAKELAKKKLIYGRYLTEEEIRLHEVKRSDMAAVDALSPSERLDAITKKMSVQSDDVSADVQEVKTGVDACERKLDHLIDLHKGRTVEGQAQEAQVAPGDGGQSVGAQTQEAHAVPEDGGQSMEAQTQEAHVAPGDGGQSVEAQTQEAQVAPEDGGQSVEAQTQEAHAAPGDGGQSVEAQTQEAHVAPGDGGQSMEAQTQEAHVAPGDGGQSQEAQVAEETSSSKGSSSSEEDSDTDGDHKEPESKPMPSWKDMPGTCKDTLREAGAAMLAYGRAHVDSVFNEPPGPLGNRFHREKELIEGMVDACENVLERDAKKRRTIGYDLLEELDRALTVETCPERLAALNFRKRIIMIHDGFRQFMADRKLCQTTLPSIYLYIKDTTAIMHEVSQRDPSYWVVKESIVACTHALMDMTECVSRIQV